MKKISCLILCLVIVFASCCFVFAANGGAPTGVTSEMTKASYWQTGDGNRVLLTNDDIVSLNTNIRSASGTYVFDLANFKATCDATELMKQLSNYSIPDTKYWVDGKEINNQYYFGKINSAVRNTGYTGTERSVTYAVCTEIADIKSIPTNDKLCDSLTDTADEMMNSNLMVNEPFIIMQRAVIDGHTFYYGYSDTVWGWVDGEKLAICKDKDEWLDAWYLGEKNGLGSKNFLIVTEDKIILEQSMIKDYPSGLHLGLGTILKLVSDDDIPTIVAERGTWYNHVVYVPTRDANGNYVKTMALISEHNSVSIGYLPLTENNVVELTFACLGNRYGWGNMFEDFDCSGLVRAVYRCFGITMPRNTTRQIAIPNNTYDVSKLTSYAKLAVLDQLPVGSLLFFPGHIMIYLGKVDGAPYVISSAGVLSDSAGEVNVQKYLSVALTPMDVRRANGSTWFDNITKVVVLTNTEVDPSLAFKDLGNDKELQEAVSYAMTLGLVNGVSDTKFAPREKLTAEQIEIINQRLANLAMTEDQKAKASELLAGKSLSRGEFIKSFYKLMN